MASPTRAYDSLMRFYDAEATYSATGSADDRHRLLSTLHPNVVLHQPSSLPYGGEWQGRDEFGRWLDTFVQAWTDITPTSPLFHSCGEDMIVSTVTLTATARATGTQVEMPMCQVIRFADGLPIEWRNFAWDTAQLLDALGRTASGDAPQRS